MLKLILGRIGSGKTTRIYKSIKQKIFEGEKVVLIVPEQYSFQTEKTMLGLLGSKGADSVEVVSFSFLARNILKKYGLNSKSALDDSMRALMMSLALESVSDKLNVYGRHKYSASVIADMLKIIKELRQCTVSTAMLRETSSHMDKSLLKNKLDEISLIADAYAAIVDRSYFDDECALDKLSGLLCEHNEFEGKTVYIDGFRGFTSQELKVLERILVGADDTYITLCSDNESHTDDFSAFSHTRRTKQKLIRLAEKSSVRIAVPEYIEAFDEKRYTNSELEILERGLYANSAEVYNKRTEHITVCSAEDFESECEYIAHTVKKLIRTEDIRCRDIAIICRSEKNYARQIRSSLIKNDIPVFEDRRQPIASQPLIEFVCGAIDIAVRGFSGDAVMRVLKTGLTTLTIDEISELENYALLWQINGGKWLENWTAHPDGLGEKMHEEDVERLKKLNSSRICVIAPLQKMRVKFKDTDGLGGAEAVYALLCEMHVAENLKKLALSLNDAGESELASEQNTIWETVIEILDRIASSLENIKLTPQRFSELLNLIVSMYTVGKIPQGLDEIVIGSADRVKTTAPKVVFAVGVNDGVFPMIQDSGGVLTDNERKTLAALNLQLGDSFEQKMAEEHFIAYSAFCSPSDRLYVTYLRKDITGAEMSHSELITQINSIFPNVTAFDTVCTPEIDYVEGKAPAFELMARLMQKGGIMYSTLRKYFSQDSDYSGKLAALDRAINKKEFEITDKNIAENLFGRNMYMSASRTEVYHKCPFEYFCKYGLNASPRKVAELDPMQKGTAIHYILEKLISAYGSDGLCSMEKSQRDKCVKDMLEEYFSEILASGEDMGERFYYLFSQLLYIVSEVVDRLVKEFSVSEFVPVAFELKIDNDGEVKTYDIELPDGGMLKLNGSVDRVDVFESESKTFVRVVDYKSGGKKFDLNEVYSGLNMQMLIYLFAIWKNGFRDYKNIEPAGILYMPVKAPYVMVERSESDEAVKMMKQKNIKMNGMILDDSRVVYSMDTSGSGVIVPAKITADGSCSGTLITLKQMELLMKRVEKILSEMAVNLHNGKICVKPSVAVSAQSPYADVCKYCDYADVCCIDEDTPVNKIETIKHEDSLKMLGGEDDA